MSTRDAIDEAEETLLRARRGDDVADALIAHLAALDALPWSNEVFRTARVVRLALLGGTSAAGLAAVVEKELPLENKGRLTGLLLRDGDPLTTRLPKTPWTIPARASLEEALARVWRACPDAAPLVEVLQRRALGLAIFEEARTGAPLLGYLVYHERDVYEIPKAQRKRRRPPFDRREALAWEPFGDLSLVVGRAPLAGTPTLRDGVAIPSPLRAFYAVHAGFGDGMWSLAPPDQLHLWSEMMPEGEGASLVRTEDKRERRRGDQLLAFFSYGDDRSDLFDLSTGDDEPPVRAWGEGCLWSGPGRPFADWLTDNRALFVEAADPDAP